MAFVSDIVFAGKEDPDHRIIEWLLNCVTFSSGRTRQFSLFNTAEVIDPNPVLRSFLLKLLLQCNESSYSMQQLDVILSEWSADSKYMMQTMVLFMNCWKVGLFILYILLLLAVHL